MRGFWSLFLASRALSQQIRAPKFNLKRKNTIMQVKVSSIRNTENSWASKSGDNGPWTSHLGFYKVRGFLHVPDTNLIEYFKFFWLNIIGILFVNNPLLSLYCRHEYWSLKHIKKKCRTAWWDVAIRFFTSLFIRETK